MKNTFWRLKKDVALASLKRSLLIDSSPSVCPQWALSESGYRFVEAFVEAF